MTLLLSDREERALRRALDAYLPDLRYEAARVKLMRDRHELVVLDEVLSNLRERLGEEEREEEPAEGELDSSL